MVGSHVGSLIIIFQMVVTIITLFFGGDATPFYYSTSKEIPMV